MADSALLASLLMGQKRRSDPNEAHRKFGQNLMTVGSSTAPVQSPLEGLARALQGGLGGLAAGYADQRDEERSAKTISGLSAALQAKTPQEMTAALKGAGNDSETLAPILGQMLSEKMARNSKNEQSTDSYVAAGGIVPGAAQPQTAMPAPQGPMTPGAGPNPTNVGNITNGQGGFRQYPTPEAGTADLTNLLRSYPVQYNQGQPMTLAQIAARYAPADNGRDPMLKGNDPNVWARNVGQIAGLDPNQPLDFDNPAIVTAVTRGINAQEKGQQNAQPAPVLQQGVAQGMDPTAFPPQGGNAQQPGQPLTVNMTQPQGLPPQGSQDGTTMPPQAQPQATPQAPQISPTAAALSQQAQQAYNAGDRPRAALLQQKAQEEQAKYVGELDKETRGQTLKQPQQNIDNEGKLRDDFNNLQPVKDYRKAATVFRSAVEASKQNSKASDLNMVYAFATMMDPGSVVRDQESNMVIATAGASDRIKGLVAGLAGNSALGPDVKEKLLTEMGSRYEAYKVAHDNLATTFRGIAGRSGANHENVITPFPEVPYTKGGPSAAGADLRKKYGLE